MDHGTECSIQKKSVDTASWRQLPSQAREGKIGSYTYRSKWEGTRVPTDFFSTYYYSSSPVPDTSPILELQMDGWGTQGVQLAYPSKPALSIAQTIAELKREGLPGIPGEQIRRYGAFAGGGGEFLNYQFGFKPIISDINALLRYDAALVDSLEKLRRDTNGDYRRRATVVHTVTDTTTLGTQNLYPSLPQFFSNSEFGGQIGAVSVTEKSSIDVWFSGAFRFHMPEIYKRIPQLDELRSSMFKAGLEPSPELIWQLTPWSWLVDWGFSVGSAISNLSRFQADGAVMRYGYVMYRKVTTRTYSNPFWGALQVHAVNFQRRRANPFGFGITFEDLSPRQWAILAALGLSRGRDPDNL